MFERALRLAISMLQTSRWPRNRSFSTLTFVVAILPGTADFDRYWSKKSDLRQFNIKNGIAFFSAVCISWVLECLQSREALCWKSSRLNAGKEAGFQHFSEITVLILMNEPSDRAVCRIRDSHFAVCSGCAGEAGEISRESGCLLTACCVPLEWIGSESFDIHEFS